jgi:hypothetical protein
MTKGTLKGLDFILLPPEYFAAYASDKKYGPMSKETLLKESRSCMGNFFFFVRVLVSALTWLKAVFS